MAQEKALVKPESFPPLAGALEQVQDVVRENLGETADITPFDLERIRIPAGGGTQWELPDGTTAPAFDAVIIGWSNCRGYWPGSFAGGEPPQCWSTDGVTGIGDPGGECRRCPYAQFGTAVGADGESRRGQACKAMRRLLLLLPGQALPVLLTLPPTSLRPCRQYMLRLVSSDRLAYWQVITRFGLARQTNRSGIAYSVVSLERGAVLPEEMAARAKAYADAVRGILSGPVAADEYVAPNGEGVEL